MIVKIKDRTIRVLENHWLFKLPFFKQFNGMTVNSKLVLFKAEYKDLILRHELVHTNQMAKEKWVVVYYFKYFWTWYQLYRKSKDWIQAYMEIPYEREAYKYPLSSDQFEIISR